LCGSLV